MYFYFNNPIKMSIPINFSYSINNIINTILLILQLYTKRFRVIFNRFRATRGQ